MAAPYPPTGYGSTAPTEPGSFPLTQPGGTATTQPGSSPAQPGGMSPAQPGGTAPSQPTNYPPAQPGGFPSAQGGGTAPPQPGGFPPAQGGGTAPPQPGGTEPPQPGAFPPAQDGGTSPPQAGGYPPAQPGGFPTAPAGGSVSPQQGGYPSAQPGGFPPAQGYPPGPAQGNQPGPAPGYQPGPAQGYQPGPAQGYQPGPAQGYQPGPAPGYQPGPAQGNQPGPPPGYPTKNGGGAELPPEPSAPVFETIPGYENVGGEQGVPAGPPPAYAPPGQPMDPPVEVFDRAAAINEDEATEALQNYVAEQCCYGKGASKDMKISNMESSSAFHYKLESFVESRATNWCQEPYSGQPIDGPQNGPAPSAWSIQVEQPPPFTPRVIYVEIPHTANVQRCHHCHGHGQIRCNHCYGRGYRDCHHCHHGYRTNSEGQREPCWVCHGRSYVNCTYCHGHGRITCTVCQGNGRLKKYLRLTVQWKIEYGQHVVEKTDLPNELITQVGGVQIFCQELPRVFPLTSFFVEDINVASQRILNGHNALANSNVVHRQRHELRSVPVNEVNVSWKDKSYRFWAYGAEKKVYCPDYPQQCCWGCSIL